MSALDLVDDWPVPTVAAAVIGSSGVLAGHGDLDRLVSSINDVLGFGQRPEECDRIAP